MYAIIAQPQCAVVERWFRICLPCTIRCQMVPFQYSSSLSLRRIADLPLGRFPPQSFQVVIRDIQRLSRILLMSSDYFNNVYDLRFLSYPYIMFHVLPSICVCAAATLLFAWAVRAHVFAPYITILIQIQMLYCNMF